MIRHLRRFFRREHRGDVEIALLLVKSDLLGREDVGSGFARGRGRAVSALVPAAQARARGRRAGACGVDAVTAFTAIADDLTGACDVAPDLSVTVYPVRVADSDVLVELP